ncbi:MAG: class I SAM-dependent methyltransferase [Alphaproteobacteria bacterium]|nr:class I SAM-dependent methyltransferase [Alphaproteobacteria bacterium]
MTADAAFWDKLAERYAAQPVKDPDAFDRKIAITRARIKPGDVVLNIGCGTGSLSLRLADTGAELHGLDISSEMVRIARGKVEAAGVDNITFHVGAFDEGFTAFADGSLDGICAYSILHLLEDRQAALAQIYRLLKPGGFFVSSTVCIQESWAPLAPMITVLRWLGKAPRVGSLSRAQIAAEIEAAGFVNVQQPDVGAEAMVGFVVAEKPR